MEIHLHELLAHWGYWGLFFIIMCDNMNIPFPPTEVVLAMTGWFVARGIFSFHMVFIVSTIAGTLGCFLFYCVVAYMKEGFLRRFQKICRVSDSKMHKANSFFEKYGGLSIFLGRLIPGMRTISLIPAGLLDYSPVKFILWACIGTAIWNGALLYMGHVIGSQTL